MELCHFCSKIKAIRVKQGRDYYKDLCQSCRHKEKMVRSTREDVKELVLK